MAAGLIIASLFLLFAMVLVPLAKRQGLGSVLGYLFSGILAGAILQSIANFLGAIDPLEMITNLQHASEFGVILMLFLVGLEIQPRKLWQMKTEIFGLGTSQVVMATVFFVAIGILLGLSWQAALMIGLSLSQSSTAVAIQSLNEKKWDQSVGGKLSFSALLLQDLAVIPIIALLPFLATKHEGAAQMHGGPSLLDGLPYWLHPWMGLLAICLVYLIGRYLVNPLFRFIADAKLQEIFTTAALGIVTTVAAFMSVVKLSPALGVFIAGVVLSESDYRHQLESDISPFKGLLLGLFFMTIGASFDFALFMQKPLLIMGIGFGLVLVKTLAGLIVGTFFHIEKQDRLLFSLALAQGGEFAFVLLGASLSYGVLSGELVQILKIGIAISMMLSPLLFLLYERWAKSQPVQAEKEAEDIDEIHPIIVCGFGRFGQLIVRLLASCGFRATILDFDPHHIDTLKRFGWKVYYGDASRLDLLRAAGIAKARLLIVAIDDMEKAQLLVQTVRAHFPNLPIIARARNRVFAYDLMDLGLEHVYRETMDTSLRAGEAALRILGFRAYQARRARLKFAQGDNASMPRLARLRKGDETSYLSEAKASEEELNRLLKAEFMQRSSQSSEEGWE